jgi:hypothetical protein
MADKITAYTNFNCESSVRPELRIEGSTATLTIEGNKIFDIECNEKYFLKEMLNVYIDIFKTAESELDA